MVTNKQWSWQLKDRELSLHPPSTHSQVHLTFLGRMSSQPAAASMDQVHGALVREATVLGPHPTCDALITRKPGLPLLIRTADCLPLVLWKPGILGVCHAGWRGLRAGILENTVRIMGGPENLQVWVGPAIRSCCFEVGTDVAHQFPDNTITQVSRKLHVDLPGEARLRLRETGITRVADSGLCTRCHQHMLFSYRGSPGTKKRNLTLASIV